MFGLIERGGFAARICGTALAIAFLGVSGLPAVAQGYGSHGSMMGAGSMMGGTGPYGMMQGYSGGDSDATDGKDLYLRGCASCHGRDGAGGVKFGDVTAADLRAPHLEAKYHNDDRMLARAILRGIDAAGQPLAPVMPRWQGQLTPDQTAAIIAHLKRLHR